MKDGWETKKLSEVATLQRGFDLPTQDRVSGEFPLVSSSGIIDSHNKAAVHGPGVVTGRSGSIGNVFFVEDDFWPLNTTLYVKDFHGNDPRFVFHLLKNFNLERFASGAGVPTLNRNFVHDELVRVPSLEEQGRIARTLDEAFEGVAAAKVNAEKNLENARALFESELTGVFTRRGEGWTEKNLGNIADFKNGLNYSSRSNGETVRLVGVGDFGRHYDVPLKNLESVTIDGVLDESYQLREGDIVTVRSNGSKDLVGRCMLVPKVDEGISYSGFVIRIRPDMSAVRPRLLLHFMKSSMTRQRLIGGGQGANISNINQGKLSALPLSLPPLEKQEGLADELDGLMAETERLESIYQRKVDALDELKKSLLHEAFSSNL